MWINNIRYVDDTVLIADNVNDFQQLLSIVGKRSKNMGLNININKRKFMIVTREPDTFENTTLTFENIPRGTYRVNKFKYFGKWLCENWSSDMEIKCRIETARRKFMKLREVLTNTDLYKVKIIGTASLHLHFYPDFDLDFRVKFIKCYV